MGARDNTYNCYCQKSQARDTESYWNECYDKKVNKKYLFGFDYYKQKDFYLPYSDIEKSFIDMVYFNEKLSDEVLKEIKRKIDKDRLKKYLRIYPKKIKKKINLDLLS